MKSVLISIQPKWVEKIASGKKTIEVRKNRPKLETPFKCYIYCSGKDYDEVFCVDKFMHKVFLNGKGKQKVIGEFICDYIFPIKIFTDGLIQNYNCYSMEKSCVPYDDIVNYIGNGITGYGWHISDLKIYDKPKGLSEFGNLCRKDCLRLGKGKSCEFLSTDGTPCNRIIPITRPPQSWCYVEALQ